MLPCPVMRWRFSILNWIGLGESKPSNHPSHGTRCFSILNWIGLGESYPITTEANCNKCFSILNWIGLGESTVATAVINPHNAFQYPQLDRFRGKHDCTCCQMTA